MKPSEVYLKSAMNIANGTPLSFYGESCVEICMVRNLTYSGLDSLVVQYEKMFKPDKSGNIWGYRWLDSERASCRVLALLFMHQIAKESE